MEDRTIIHFKKNLKLNKPVLVVGLPGIGNVGKLVAEHLRREFKPKEIAVMYSPHFPHQVVMLKSGGIRLVGNRFYLIKDKKGKHDIILLTGETQAVTPEGQYEVNAKIIDFFIDKMKGEFVYTLGGYSVSREISKAPKVYGNVTRKEIAKDFKNYDIVFGKSRGLIWGSAGMLLAFAKMRKIDGICIMGETSTLDIDATAAKAVLLVLAKMLGIEIHTEKLDKIIEQTAKVLMEIEKQSSGFQTQVGSPGEPKPSYIR